jgi:hypothetical protein
MRPRTLLLVGATVATLLGGAVAAAQYRQPVIPAANQCTVTPRDIAFFRQFVGTPAASPAAATPEATPADAATFQMPEGGPVDRAMRQGVLDTIRQVAACINAGNYLALYALYTDAEIAREAMTDPLSDEDVESFAQTPVPLEGEGRAAILAVDELRLLPDGRVAALVDYYDPFQEPPGPARYFFILVNQNGRWLIDEEIALGPIEEGQIGTPAA